MSAAQMDWDDRRGQRPAAMVATPTLPADAGERLALAAKAYSELKRAETEVSRIEGILAQGEFAARRHNLSRSDQFRAWARRNEAETLLKACLGVQP